MSDSQLSTCVVVPSVPEHVSHLDDLFDSVASQTVLPDKVVVALSETDSQTCNFLETEFRNKFTDIDIKFDCVDQKAFSATNRNRGSHECHAQDLIAFMDADDIMHPKRVQLARDMIARYDADALAHTYSSEIAHVSGNEKVHMPDDVRRQHEIQLLNNGPIHFENVAIHHGHPTVRREVFEREKQDDSERYRRSEDSEYLRRLTDKNYGVMFVESPLSVYRSHLSAENN